MSEEGRTAGDSHSRGASTTKDASESRRDGAGSSDGTVAGSAAQYDVKGSQREQPPISIRSSGRHWLAEACARLCLRLVWDGRVWIVAMQLAPCSFPTRNRQRRKRRGALWMKGKSTYFGPKVAQGHGQSSSPASSIVDSVR